MDSSKLKSDIAESFVVFKLIELGFEVFTPANAQSKTDLIVKSVEGVLHKVQIKSSNCDEGRPDGVCFTVAKNNIKYNAGSYKQFYENKDVDFFLLVNLINMEIYVLPFKEKANKFRVRTIDGGTKSGQVSKINHSKDFLLTKNSFN